MDDIAGRKKLLEVSGLNRGRILDIGMGDCACMSFFMAKRGFHVVGIDRSPKAVHDSRASAEKMRFKGSFTARLENVERLPFGHNEFDAVIAYNSFHHMADIRKAIREMFRVCSIGGRVVISELIENDRVEKECKDDAPVLLRKIKIYLAVHARRVRSIRTHNQVIFICRKPSR